MYCNGYLARRGKTGQAQSVVVTLLQVFIDLEGRLKLVRVALNQFLFQAGNNTRRKTWCEGRAATMLSLTPHLHGAIRISWRNLKTHRMKLSPFLGCANDYASTEVAHTMPYITQNRCQEWSQQSGIKKLVRTKLSLIVYNINRLFTRGMYIHLTA